jgi:hypothetical protein
VREQDRLRAAVQAARQELQCAARFIAQINHGKMRSPSKARGRGLSLGVGALNSGRLSHREVIGRSVSAGVDGGVDNCPYWEVLTAFGEEPSFLHRERRRHPGPRTDGGEVADDNASEKARRKIDAINEPVEWYFTLAAETPVAMAPGDTGTPVAKLGTLLSAREGRRAAAAADPLRGAAAIGPDWLGAGRPFARSRPITSATPARQLANGRWLPSIKQRERPEAQSPPPSEHVLVRPSGAFS